MRVCAFAKMHSTIEPSEERKVSVMDQIKIGQFIAQKRKAAGYTQRRLADILGISDKTVSKWERGNGMPEVSLMLPLCRALHINVNELLSGEDVTDANYKQKAEENMMHLAQEKDDHFGSNCMCTNDFIGCNTHFDCRDASNGTMAACFTDCDCTDCSVWRHRRLLRAGFKCRYLRMPKMRRTVCADGGGVCQRSAYNHNKTAEMPALR